MGTRRRGKDGGAWALRTLYQPIVELSSGGITAFDATTIFASRVRWPAAAWFEAAADRGVRVSLECRAISQAFLALPVLPRPLLLCVNASSETMCSTRLAAVLAQLDADRVVIQVAGAESVGDVEAFRRAAARLRTLGARLAIAAVGARIDHMPNVARLRPDIIKLDHSVVEEAAGDTPLAAHARGAVRFADETGIPVVADGVATVAELQALRALGVQFGQGPLLSAPRPLEDWRRRFRPCSPGSAA